MKKILKGNKGFSLVELLIALLIMAVIAGTAITLFGGVLETSKGGADREAADSIKRAILTYMNSSNDLDLSALGIVNGTSSDADLVVALANVTEIKDTGTNNAGRGTTTKNDADVNGKYGPFLEKIVEPTQNGMSGWDIKINTVSMVVTVVPAASGALDIVSTPPTAITTAAPTPTP